MRPAYRLLPPLLVALLLLLPLGVTPVGAATTTTGIAAWGNNRQGELGNENPGSVAERYTAAPVVGAGRGGIVRIAAGRYHDLAIGSDGILYSWGGNDRGQLGLGSTAVDSVYRPTAVPGLAGVTAVAANAWHNLALAGGTVYAWGDNTAFQNGPNGSTSGNCTVSTSGCDNHPVAVGGLGNVAALGAGADESLAVAQDGGVWAWGQVGTKITNSNSADTPTPTRIPGVGGAVAATGGEAHTVALLSNGTIMVWGGNGEGEQAIPDSDLSAEYPPHLVNGLSGVMAVASGYRHVVALKGDGTVWAWGDNSDGQLGATTGPLATPGHQAPGSATPVQVGGLGGVVAIGAGDNFGLAVKADGTVWMWGENANALQGNGAAGDSTTPVQVPNLTGVTAVAGGGQYAFALQAVTIPTFGDVPSDYWAYNQIGSFAQRGITTGCDVNTYCPERGVTRAEMGVFLDRTLGYGTPPPPSGQTFRDVPTNYWAYASIEQFAKLGITTGCDTDAAGNRSFCPDRGVTRAEMAAFLIRALGASQVTPATPTFADVPASHPQYGYIEALVKLGVTTGCGTDAAGKRYYCPDRGVTRAEMAVFITRAFP